MKQNGEMNHMRALGYSKKKLKFALKKIKRKKFKVGEQLRIIVQLSFQVLCMEMSTEMPGSISCAGGVPLRSHPSSRRLQR
jgi:hypothetical protein